MLTAGLVTSIVNGLEQRNIYYLAALRLKQPLLQRTLTGQTGWREPEDGIEPIVFDYRAPD